jgi:hypothetical protein
MPESKYFDNALSACMSHRLAAAVARVDYQNIVVRARNTQGGEEEMVMKRRAAFRHGLVAVGAAALTAVAAPAALASDDWCDSDPVQLVVTNGGKLVPIFVTNGVRSLSHLPQAVLAKITHRAQSVDGGKATLVTVEVTVPNGLLGKRFETRTIASSLPLGTGTVYGTTTGSSGSEMTVQFKLPVG